MNKLLNPEKYAATDTELAQQTALFMWTSLPDVQAAYPEFKFMYSIPNGGVRHIATAARFRASGVKKGVTDVCLPVRRGLYSGVYLEMKRATGGVLSDEQSEFMAFVMGQGYCIVVAYGFEQARDALIKYMSM